MELVSGLISVSAVLSLLKQNQGLDIPIEISQKITQAFEDGSGANEINKIFYLAEQVLATSAADSHDLSGALTDPYGDAVVFSKIRLIWLVNTSPTLDPASAASLKVGAGSNPLAAFSDVSDALPVAPGGMVLLINPTLAGVTVTAATGDIFKVLNLSASELARYMLLVLGT